MSLMLMQRGKMVFGKDLADAFWLMIIREMDDTKCSMMDAFILVTEKRQRRDVSVRVIE